MNIKNNMSEDIAKKIIGKKENAKLFLLKLKEKKGKVCLKMREITRGKNKGQKVLDYSTTELWKKIVEEWDYDVALQIIRDIFKSTKKYKNGKDADKAMQILILE